MCEGGVVENEWWEMGRVLGVLRSWMVWKVFRVSGQEGSKGEWELGGNWEGRSLPLAQRFPPPIISFHTLHTILFITHI